MLTNKDTYTRTHVHMHTHSHTYNIYIIKLCLYDYIVLQLSIVEHLSIIRRRWIRNNIANPPYIFAHV